MNQLFKERLEGLILNLHISQRQFCNQFNNFEPTDIKLNPSSLCDILNGVKRKDEHNNEHRIERGIKAELIPKLCDFFNVSSDYLLGLTGPQTRNMNARSIAKLTGIDADSISYLIELKKKYGNYTTPYDGMISYLIKDYYESVIDINMKEAYHLVALNRQNIFGMLNKVLDLEFFSTNGMYNPNHKKEFAVCDLKEAAESDEEVFDALTDSNGYWVSLNYDQLCSVFMDELKALLLKKGPDYVSYIEELNNLPYEETSQEKSNEDKGSDHDE